MPPDERRRNRPVDPVEKALQELLDALDIWLRLENKTVRHFPARVRQAHERGHKALEKAKAKGAP